MVIEGVKVEKQKHECLGQKKRNLGTCRSICTSSRKIFKYICHHPNINMWGPLRILTLHRNSERVNRRLRKSTNQSRF